MQRSFTALLVCACSWGLLAQAQPAAAQTGVASADKPAAVESGGVRPDHLWTADYLRSVLGDTKAVVTAPANWDENDWLEACAAVAGVGLTSAFDRTIRDHVQARRTPGEDRFMEHWQNLNSFYLLGAFEVWGELGGDTRAKNVAMDGLTSSIIASGLITPVLKFAVGRERPNTSTDPFVFKPFSGHYSFPSGHATQAFAVATVIAEHYPLWWVEGLAYGSAALVGYARIEQNAHWASDVVAGSLIGWSVAHAVVNRHNGPPNPRKLSWTPFSNGRDSGLVFFKTF